MLTGPPPLPPLPSVRRCMKVSGAVLGAWGQKQGGVEESQKSACSSGTTQTTHVLSSAQQWSANLPQQQLEIRSQHLTTASQPGCRKLASSGVWGVPSPCRSEALPSPAAHPFPSAFCPLPACLPAGHPMHQALCARLDGVPLCARWGEGCAARPPPLQLHGYRLPRHEEGAPVA